MLYYGISMKNNCFQHINGTLIFSTIHFGLHNPCACRAAKRVFSVTMRKGPWVERPTPPPMVMPSRRLT